MGLDSSCIQLGAENVTHVFFNALDHQHSRKRLLLKFLLVLVMLDGMSSGNSEEGALK